MIILITGAVSFIGFSTAKELLKNKNNLVHTMYNYSGYYSRDYKKERLKNL